MNTKKTCRVCEKSMTLTLFHIAKGNTDGHSNKCKDCTNRGNREYYKTDKFKQVRKSYEELNKDRRRAYNVEKNKRERDYLRDYKVSHGCSICGFNGHHAALQFDHIIPRSSTGQSKVNSKSELIRQQDNIRVLCGNCNYIEAFEDGLFSIKSKELK